LAEAKRFYNRQQQGLDESFQREAEAAANLNQERPLAWQVEVESVRRFLFDRFPYKMLYIIRAQRITADIFHLSVKIKRGSQWHPLVN
jgi:hypothetical protein